MSENYGQSCETSKPTHDERKIWNTKDLTVLTKNILFASGFSCSAGQW